MKIHSSFFKKYSIIFIVFFYCCNKPQENKLDEVKRLSKVEIPPNSSLIEYYDNDESQITFHIKLKETDVENFFIKNDFIEFDNVKRSQIQSIDKINKIFINDIENSFVPPKKIIINQNSYILKNNHTFMLLNKKTGQLWGLISYD